MSRSSQSRSDRVGVKGSGGIGTWEVVAIGVGGMVGGGIFAVLGLAVQYSGGGTPVAFAIAGLVALLTSYSYAKLAVAFPTQGGTVVFLDGSLYYCKPTIGRTYIGPGGSAATKCPGGRTSRQI